MNRNEIITEILNLYDQIEVLNQRLACKPIILDADNDTPIPVESVEDPMTRKLVDFAKKTLAERVTDTWGGDVKYAVNDDGVVSYTKYEVWIKNKFRDREIPDNMSKNDVLESCYDELHAIYEKEKAKAEKDYKESLEEKESENE